MKTHFLPCPRKLIALIPFSKAPKVFLVLTLTVFSLAMQGQQTITLSPTDDAYTQGTGRGGETDKLRIEQGYREIYLKFTGSNINGTITSVSLDMRTYSDTGNGTVTVYKGNSSNWTETTITGSNAPGTSTNLGSRSSSGSGLHSYSLSVADPSLYQGTFTLVLKHTGTNDLAYASTENATASLRPVLKITYTQNNTDTTPPTITNLSSSNITSSSVDLSWTSSDNVGVTSQKITYGTNTVTLGAGDQSTTITGLSASTPYTFTLEAKDAANNATTQSVSVTTSSGGGGNTGGHWTQTSDNKLYYTGGNVGIGTTNPSAKLDVQGHLTFLTGEERLYWGSKHSGSTDHRNYLAPRNSDNSSWDWSNEFGFQHHHGNWYFENGLSIGSLNLADGYKLSVDGMIRAREIKVDNDNWADYVFTKDYNLPTLKEVKKHIKEKGHLINIPSAEEVQAQGVELGNMNRLLLEKIEELTLYILQQQDEIERLQELEKRIQRLERE